MPLNAGARLGPYEILAPAGAGGMGEVYRGRDTRLDRTVAIKVLPEQFSENPDLKQRFEREARAISSLNHPNICHLYDVGHQDGTDYLVMEYIEGESLAERLGRGPLSLEQTLKTGIEIADALDKAHRQGIIHRDLKPGNVMLTKSGAKLLDFGLAKPAASMKAASSLTGIAATVTSPVSPITQQGVIVGTFQYMAPEQVEGKDADARSDIFALGAVLYEMATGKRAFSGKSALSVASSILEKDPEPISKSQPMTPPAFEHVVATCLAKDADARWQSAADVARQLRWVAEGGSQVSAAPLSAPRKRRDWVAWTLAALLLVAAAIGYYLAYREHSRVLSFAVHSWIEQPDKNGFAFTGDAGGPPAISPDGTQIVFAASNANGKQQLWVRALDSLSPQPLAGTEDATFPFWSPDSRKIAFFANSALRVIESRGGPVLVVCPTGLGRGGAWSKDDVILFSPDFRAGLYTVPAGGGTPKLVEDTASSPYSSYRWPQFMPDGKHFLFLGVKHEKTNESTLFFASLGDLKPKIVMPVTAAARYASGRLFSMRNGTLMTQPFDPSAGKVTGEAAPLVEGVLWDVGVWRGVFDVSENGLLVYEQGSASAARSLGWFDQNGKMLSSIDVPTGYQTMALSPDGRFLAVQGNPATDLWNYDLARGIHTRLTFDSATHAYPAWSPDDKWIAYVSIQGSGAGDKICRKRADGSGAEEVLWESPKNKVLSSWSPDGKYLFFIQSNDGNAGSGIWALPVEGDRKPFSVVETPSQTTDGAVSPDGKWFSYSSAESGRSEVYVIGFPKPAGKWQVSLDGGSNALWSKDGRTIFFLSVTNRLMSTEVNGKGSEFSVGKARSYFILPASVATQPWFGTSPDGKRFVSPAATTENQPPMTLVTNWTAELKR